MTRAQALYLHITVGLVALTGIVFAWMKYGMTGSDELAVVNHPLQPWMLAAHVVAAPLLVFGFGWIASTHIWPGFLQKRAPKWRSGVATMWMIVPMTMSGYLLQVSVSDAMRKGAAGAHWVTSAIFVLAYAVHLGRRWANASPERIALGDAMQASGGETTAAQRSVLRFSRRLKRAVVIAQKR